MLDETLYKINVDHTKKDNAIHGRSSISIDVNVDFFMGRAREYSSTQQEMQNSFNDKMRKNDYKWNGISNECKPNLYATNGNDAIECMYIERARIQQLNYFNNIFCLFEIRMKTMMSNEQRMAQENKRMTHTEIM